MRPEKQLLLDEIKDKITNSKAIVFASYKALEPNKSFAFRSNLAKTGSSLEIVKKRILVKAAGAAQLTISADALEGHIAVIFGEQDPIQMTKAIYQFRSENEDLLEVLGGHFEGVFCSSNDVELLSKLPGREEMRSQFLATLEAPMSQTLAVMEALLTSVMHCLENQAEKTNSSN